MKTRYQLIDADTGKEVETFDPLTIAIAQGDPALCRLLNWLSQQALSAYVPASTLSRDYNHIRRTLDRHPEIGRLRHGQRCRVHAGQYLEQAALAETIADLERERGEAIDRYQTYMRDLNERIEQARQEHRKKLSG
jgi:hypothetical protein